LSLLRLSLFLAALLVFSRCLFSFLPWSMKREDSFALLPPSQFPPPLSLRLSSNHLLFFSFPLLLHKVSEPFQVDFPSFVSFPSLLLGDRLRAPSFQTPGRLVLLDSRDSLSLSEIPFVPSGSLAYLRISDFLILFPSESVSVLLFKTRSARALFCRLFPLF